MSSRDAELEEMRARVSCAVLLERHSPPWQLDKKQSTRRCLKYRRAEGEILLVTHEGRGWWDPCSSAKGDIFALVRFLSPSLNFAEIRNVLRPFIGSSPAFPVHERPSTAQTPDVPFTRKWARCRLPRQGSLTWRYLTEARCLPPSVMAAAINAGVLREGPYGSAWFAHLDQDGQLTGIEMRGPRYRGFSPGGSKTLFQLPGRLSTSHVPNRRVVTEGPIDAMSVAAVEGLRADTLYLATGGGMGPGTIAALTRQLEALSTAAGTEVVIATDDDAAGHNYAERLTKMAADFHLKVCRLLPTGGAKDWNEVLQQRSRV